MAQQAPADIEHDFAGLNYTPSYKWSNRYHSSESSNFVCFWTVYGRKPSKNQKDHREKLLANSKPVEKMAERRMVRPVIRPTPAKAGDHVAPRVTSQTGWVLARAQVGMLKMIRNLAFAHRSQHVQQGRFNTEDEVRTPS